MKKILTGFAVAVLLAGCGSLPGRPFTAYDETLQQLWDGPQQWAEDWCDQSEQFREAYSGVVAYRMRPYGLSIECP